MTHKAEDAIFFYSAMTVATGENASSVYPRGSTLTITPEIRELSKDRTGDSWLDLSEAEQRERWGEVRFGHGEAPGSIEWWNTPGDDASRHLALDMAMAQVALISDPVDRAKAADAARQKYGRRSSATKLSSWGVTR
jgi:hypothetical protein